MQLHKVMFDRAKISSFHIVLYPYYYLLLICLKLTSKINLQLVSLHTIVRQQVTKVFNVN